MRIGLLTGGGDCPGLNAVIRAVVVQAEKEGYEVIGFLEGWKGVLENKWEPLNTDRVEDIHREGGTILYSSRTNPFNGKNGVEEIKKTLSKNEVDALIAIGGDDTLGVANKLYQEGLKTIGVPKTIDNDLWATDYTFGFDSAVNVAVQCLDRLHTTAKSHRRIIVVEIMGRHAGWITLEAGLGGGAHIILIPEVPFTLEEICQTLTERKKKGKTYSIVAVAEGARIAKESKFKNPNLKGTDQSKERDAFGNIVLAKRGIAQPLSSEIEYRTGIETRSTILGHIQRGGRPSAFDRYLATRFGLKAMELVKQGRFGEMASLRGTNIISVPLRDAVGKSKTVPTELFEEVIKPFWGI